MRRAIADSDDDEDDNLVLEESRRDAGVLLPGSGENVDVEGAIQCQDGTVENSTGSTERLRRDILSAERRLLTNSAPEAMDGLAMVSSSSPSIQANKRRATSVIASQTTGSTTKGAKRTKTMMRTYGSTKHTYANDDSGFERLKDDEGVLRTSQSARFTEHSGMNSSVQLPSMSTKEGFLIHEPNVMFRDSGSTIADTSSIQQRMLEEALGGKEGLLASTGNLLKPNEQQKASSPWSASELNDTPKEGSSEKAFQVDTLDEESAIAGCTVSHPGGSCLEDGSVNVRKDVNSSSADHKPPQADELSNPQPSPAVEIRQREKDLPILTREGSKSPQRARRGRKRTAEQEDVTDLLISDDRPIGLPQEQYKPRPSRRRATPIHEQPVDYSIRPEKAARVKQTKTSRAVSSSTQVEIDLITNANSGNQDTPEIQSGSVLPVAEASSTDISSNIEVTEIMNNKHKESGQNPAEKDTSPQSTIEQEVDEATFVKPSQPTRKSKSASKKSMRSQTTVFEDHSGFQSSQRLPNLTQQQAARRSALQAVQNEATTSRRKRKVISDDDDDENGEDEEPKEESEEETSPPKKRQRGRPRKSTAKPETESNEKTSEQSDKAEEKQTELTQIGKAPKKRGRGRPSKASDAATSTIEPGDQANEPLGGEPLNQAEETRSPDTNHSAGGETSVTGNTDGASVTEAPSTKLPTPSPETQNPPQEVRNPKPMSHSPISRTSAIQHRVGLSRNQRIPSLLKTMNPKR